MQMYDLPDHPVIRNMEATEYPDGKTPDNPMCPVCYEEDCGIVYVNADHAIVGCSHCVSKVDSDTVPSYLRKSDVPVCPICGKECEAAYLDRNGAPEGCDNCISEKDSWQVEECFLISLL